MRAFVLTMALLISFQAHAFGKRKPEFQKPDQFSGFSELNLSGERALAEIEARRWQRERTVTWHQGPGLVLDVPFKQKLEIRVFGSHLQLDSESLEIATLRTWPYASRANGTPLIVKKQLRGADGRFEILLAVDTTKAMDPEGSRIGLAYANPAVFEAQYLEDLPPEDRGYNPNLPEHFEYLMLSWNPSVPDELLVKAYVDGNSSPFMIRYDAQPEEAPVLLCKTAGYDVPELYWIRATEKDQAVVRYFTYSEEGTFDYRDRCWNREGHMFAMYEYPACVLVLSEARLLADLRREIGTYYFYADSERGVLAPSRLICIER